MPKGSANIIRAGDLSSACSLMHFSCSGQLFPSCGCGIETFPLSREKRRFLPAGAGLQVVIFSLIFFCHFARKRPHKSLYDLKLGMEHLLAMAKIMVRSDLASEAIWRPKRPPNYFGSSSHNEFGSSSHNEFGSSSHNEQCKETNCIIKIKTPRKSPLQWPPQVY